MLGFRVGYWSRCQRRRFAGGASVRGGNVLQSSLHPSSVAMPTLPSNQTAIMQPGQGLGSRCRRGQMAAYFHLCSRRWAGEESCSGRQDKRYVTTKNGPCSCALHAWDVGRSSCGPPGGGGPATTQPCAERPTQLSYCTASANITQGTVEFKPPPA